MALAPVSTRPFRRFRWWAIMAVRFSPFVPFQGGCMTTLQLPRKHEWQELAGEHGRFVVEPFEPGFALTVGNAFRRVLLSSIEGAAPTWVKIENVLHEFSFLSGVMEDTLDILTNIRKVVFKLHGERSRLLRLRATRPA